MKNILKLMSLLIVTASVIPAYATEQGAATAIPDEQATFQKNVAKVEQVFASMTEQERAEFYEQITAREPKDTDHEKPNTLAAYAEAGICGLGLIPTIGLATASGILLTQGSVIPGTLMLAGFAACITLPNIVADKLFSKATRQRAYEIRKAWVTLESNDSELKQKIFDSVFFLGCLSAPIITAYCLAK